MKKTILLILFAISTVLCFYFPNKSAVNQNKTQTVEVGPNQIYTWSPGHIITLQGTYSVKSENYFEINSGHGAPIQALLEAPEPGFNQGLYWVRNLSMTGDWNISTTAKIFSMEKSSITVTSTNPQKVFNLFSANIIAILLWLIATLLYFLLV